MEDRTREPSLTEVPEKAKRRRFSIEYKLRILSEADRCSRHGELGELLRREGLYSSHLADWRKQRERGTLSAKKRGRKADPNSNEAAENKRLRRKNKRLQEQLRKAELIIDVQKKVAALLGNPIGEEDERK